jgi:hypothetical protein
MEGPGSACSPFEVHTVFFLEVHAAAGRWLFIEH